MSQSPCFSHCSTSVPSPAIDQEVSLWSWHWGRLYAIIQLRRSAHEYQALHVALLSASNQHIVQEGPACVYNNEADAM
eukprot:16494-Heterococcus_DN1.PRE.2